MEKIQLPLYDVVNKLFFGFLFVLYIMIRFPFNLFQIIQFNFLPETILIGFWISFIYFCGYCINRIGSIIIEIVCIKIKLFYWESYEKYCKVAQNKQLYILNREYGNSRTFCSLFLILILIEVYHGYYNYILCLVLFFCLFILSARKHTKKITAIINKGEN